jgi:diguanylate cyclase (GGDEF)-like protein
LARALLPLLGRLAVAAAALAAAFAFVFFADALPPSLAGLKVYGPYLLFAAGAALALAFDRGRALLALTTLIAAYAAQQAWLQEGLAAPQARAVYLALTVLVPLNLAALAILPERGTFNRHGAMRLGVIALEIALAALVVAAAGDGVAQWAARKFIEPAPIAIGAMPQAGIAAAGLALVVTLAAAALSRSAISASCAGAIVAFVVAAHVPTASLTFAVFTTAAELMVAIAILQDTFRMAFRDELTGLASRRALNERLATLGRHYAIAMIDVDHFKSFNDTWGHDLGDQVLRMVAAHIAEVGGGGRAFRYGGEEFAVVFAGRDAAHALPHLEALRRAVEAYQLALRAPDRPRKSRGSKRRAGGWRGRQSVSVTVSIGVAERGERLATPQAVIEAADRALYRAKEKGRNTVSR